MIMIIWTVSVHNGNDTLVYRVTNTDGTKETYTEHNVPDSIIHFINYSSEKQNMRIIFRGETVEEYILFRNRTICEELKKSV